jgi:hypothetical protein
MGHRWFGRGGRGDLRAALSRQSSALAQSSKSWALLAIMSVNPAQTVLSDHSHFASHFAILWRANSLSN